MNQSISQKSLFLMGTYRHLSDWHGPPESRAAAFDLGYVDNRLQITIDQQYDNFQDNLFSTVVHSEGQI
jgi:hypothetical protein